MQSSRDRSTSMRFSDVFHVDLRNASDAPSTFEELLNGISSLGEEGIVRPWSLLLVDDVSGL